MKLDTKELTRILKVVAVLKSLADRTPEEVEALEKIGDGETAWRVVYDLREAKAEVTIRLFDIDQKLVDEALEYAKNKAPKSDLKVN